MLIGNPAAPLKLVEYGSYTCSHCAAFAAESDAVLKTRDDRDRASVSLEYRHLIRDRLDLAAAILARCAGTARFASASSAIFAAQPTWLQARDRLDRRTSRGRAAIRPRQTRTLADASGLTALMTKRGLTAAQIDACFANTRETDTIVKLTADAPAR